MKSITFFLLLLSVFHCAFTLEEKKSKPFTSISLPENECLEAWDSAEGLSRLQKSEAKENFWKLLRYYESQIRVTYCAVATSVITLNALGVEAPHSPILKNYRMFTQEEFFTDDIKAVVDPIAVAERGMPLKELTLVLKTFPLEVLEYEAQSLSHEEIRHLMISALKNPNQCVLALYQRKEIMQEGGGHWSPIAAYDAESDSFLVLDVGRYKYPPVWVDAATFINAMQTANIYNKSRGFIVVSKL